MQGIAALRQHADFIFKQAVVAADPGLAVQSALRSNSLPPPDAGGRLILIAVGKAAPQMMRAVLDQVDGPYDALVVTHYENEGDVAGARILKAAHPVPDENGLAAGQEVMRLLMAAGAADRVVVLMSGGGSALLPAPVDGVSLSDKAAVNALLLASGLEINDMNLVRQQLSQLKGGGMLRFAHPAPVTSYILSDVIGDDLRAVASGPTVSPIGTAAQAVDLLQGVGVSKDLPASVRAHLLSEGAGEGGPAAKVSNHLIGSNRHSLDAALAAVDPAFPASIVSDALVGDVSEAASVVLEAARKVQGPAALLFGGETTVRLTGDGLGGRNQELALRVALGGHEALAGREWVFLSGGTDGRDGPTDAAGGLVDSMTVERARMALVDPRALLANNDSYRALESSGDLLMTGATGTNVADIQVMLLL